MGLNGTGAQSFSCLKAQLGYHLRTALRRLGGRGDPRPQVFLLCLHPQHWEKFGFPVIGEVGSEQTLPSLPQKLSDLYPAAYFPSRSPQLPSAFTVQGSVQPTAPPAAGAQAWPQEPLGGLSELSPL